MTEQSGSLATVEWGKTMYLDALCLSMPKGIPRFLPFGMVRQLELMHVRRTNFAAVSLPFKKIWRPMDHL